MARRASIVAVVSTPTGKGRPTPKRSDAARRRPGPVAPPPKTRKEAAQRQKEAASTRRDKIKTSAAAGEQTYLIKRDAGPVRALVRDTVDRRRVLAVLLLPLALVLLAAQISGNRRVLDIAFTLWLVGLLIIFVDIVLTARAIRRDVRETFPEADKMSRHVGYGLLRSTVFRRFRVPVPRVSSGG